MHSLSPCLLYQLVSKEVNLGGGGGKEAAALTTCLICQIAALEPKAEPCYSGGIKQHGRCTDSEMKTQNRGVLADLS